MPARTRPPHQQDRVVDYLRRRIVAGELAPGGQVPGRWELARLLDVSYVTVQRGVDRLVADGFLQMRARRGTFVATHPPHLYRYALAFPAREGQPGWSGFWRALATVAETASANAGRQIHCYYGVTPQQAVAPDYHRLLADVAAHRCAGLIIVAVTHPLAGTPLLTMPGLPRVAIAGGTAATLGVDAVVVPGGGEFLGRALDQLLAQGCRRIAACCIADNAAHVFASLPPLLRDRGLEYRPHWLQCLTRDYPGSANHAARLLLHGPAADRPDGLIITDDNIVTATCAGVAASGVAVPEGVRIVAHANYPLPPPAAVPVAFLGYDSRQILRHCLAAVDAIRAGRPFAAHTLCPAQFAWELGEPLPPA